MDWINAQLNQGCQLGVLPALVSQVLAEKEYRPLIRLDTDTGIDDGDLVRLVDKATPRRWNALLWRAQIYATDTFLGVL